MTSAERVAAVLARAEEKYPGIVSRADDALRQHAARSRFVRCPYGASCRSANCIDHGRRARTSTPAHTTGSTMLHTTLTTYAAELTAEFGHDVRRREALAVAAERGLTIGKYADPVEGAREGLTVDEAADIAAGDPSLVYIVTA